jgi:peroxidase
MTVKINMPAGRLDGRISNFTKALSNLPPPFFNITQLIVSFASKGLDTEDMVVLSGAHTIGISHCSSFVSDRLAVPSDINAALASSLRRQCPANPTPANDPRVHQDVVTPNALDNQYYKNVLAHKVLFTSDAALLTTPATTQMVLDSANIRGLWEDKFKKAMVKMGAIGVKTGNQGEIRRNCRVVNRY